MIGKWDIVIYILAGALILLSITHTAYVIVTCEGTTVRGAFKMECIKKEQ